MYSSSRHVNMAYGCTFLLVFEVSLPRHSNSRAGKEETICIADNQQLQC